MLMSSREVQKEGPSRVVVDTIEVYMDQTLMIKIQ